MGKISVSKMSVRKMRALASVCLCAVVAFAGAVCYFSESVAITVSSDENSPLYFGNRKGEYVALMFNCYENAENVVKIAEILEEHGFKATFFVGGCFVDDKPELLHRIAAGGHEIGNHGYFHKKHSSLNKNGNISEIKRTHELVRALCGAEMNLFAPPSGDFDKTTLQAAGELGYKTIMWTKDTIDWRDKNQALIYKRATERIAAGDFVLMHPKDHTVKALPEILAYYKKHGLKCGTVTQTASVFTAEV